MAEQDFYLKFGSNAERFAEDVKKEIGGARTELGLLSEAIKEVNRATSGSPTAKLVSGIRSDIKSAMGDVAKTIGDELRSALKSELRNINLDNVTVTTGAPGGSSERGRVSSTDVSDADKRVGDALRQMEQLGDKAGSGARDAGAAIEQALGELEDLLPRGKFKKIKAETAGLADEQRTSILAAKTVIAGLEKEYDRLGKEIRKIEGQRSAARAADDTAEDSRLASRSSSLTSRRNTFREGQRTIEDSVAATEDFAMSPRELMNRTLLRLELLDKTVAAEIKAIEKEARGIANQSEDRRRVEQGAPVGVDDATAERLVAVSNIMTTAVNNFTSSVTQFKSHIAAFKAAAQNIQVTGVQVTGTTAPVSRTTAPKPEPAPAPESVNSLQEAANALAAVTDETVRLYRGISEREAAGEFTPSDEREAGRFFTTDREAALRYAGGDEARLRIVDVDVDDLASDRFDRRPPQATAGGFNELDEVVVPPEVAAAAVPLAEAQQEAAQALSALAEIAGSNADKLAKANEATDEETDARQKVVERLTEAARAARAPGEDEALAQARKDAGPFARDVGREIPAQLASLSTVGLFRTQEQEGSDVQRRLAEALRLMAKRLSGAGTAGATEGLGLRTDTRKFSPGPYRTTDERDRLLESGRDDRSFITRNFTSGGQEKSVVLTQDEAVELENIITQMSENERLQLNAILRTLKSAKELRKKAKEVAEGIATEYSISEAQIRIGNIVPPRGTQGSFLGQEPVFERREGESEADRIARQQAGIQTLIEYREAERQAVAELIRETIASAASLKEFEKAIEILPGSLQETARELLRIFDEARESQPLVDDPTTPQGSRERDAQTASIRRSAERELADARERERERVAQELSSLSQPAELQAFTRRFGQERAGPDLDLNLERSRAQLAALQERLQEARADERVPEESLNVLRDSIERLTKGIERQRLRIEGGVDDQGRRFAGGSDVTRRFFIGDRVGPSRGFDQESGTSRTFDAANLTPDARDRLVSSISRQVGDRDSGRRVAGSLIEIYESEFARLQQATAQLNRRQGAELALSEGEAPARLAAAEARGDDVGVAKYEAQIAQAEAIIERIPEGITEVVRQLERFLTTPGVAERQLGQSEPRLAELFQGRSFGELIRGAAPRDTEPDSLSGLTREQVGVDAALAARRAFLKDADAGVTSRDSARDIRGALGEEQFQQFLAASRKAAQEAEADFDRMKIQIDAGAERTQEFAGALKVLTRALDQAEQGASSIDLAGIREALTQVGLLGSQGRRIFTGDIGAEGSVQQIFDKELGRFVERELPQSESRERLPADTTPILGDQDDVFPFPKVQQQIERFLQETEAAAVAASEGRRERERALSGERGVPVVEPTTQLEDDRKQLKQILDRLRGGGGLDVEDTDAFKRLAERIRRGADDQPRDKERSERLQELAAIADRFDIPRERLDEGGRAIETGEGFLALAQRLAASEQAMEENERAVRGNTEAQEAQAVTAERARLGRLDIESRADLAAVAGGTSFGAFDQAGLDRLGDLGIKVGNRTGSNIDDIFAQATALKDVTPGEGESTSAISQLRNILIGLIGEDGERFRPDPGEFKPITDALLQTAEAARRNIIEATATPESDVRKTLGLRVEQNVNERLIGVLTRLSGTIEALAACCKNLQSAVGARGDARTDLSAGAVARARGRGAASELISPDASQEIVELLRRASFAGAEGRDAERRRLLGSAALTARGGDVALGDNEVIGAVQALANTLPAARAGESSGLTNEDVQAVKGRLLQFATIVEQGGKAAGEAFRNDDIELAGKLLQEKTRDVAQTLQTLREVFDVSEASLKSLTPTLENLENTLQVLDAAAEASAQSAQEARPPTQEEINKAQFAGASASAFAGREVDLSDQSNDAAISTAQDALARLNNQRVDESNLIQQMQRFYPNLNDETQEYIRSLARTRNEAVEAAQSNDALAQSIASILPEGTRQKFLASVGSAGRGERPQISTDEVATEIGRGTGKQVGSSVRVALEQIYQGVPVDKAARAHAEKYILAARSQLNTYRTPFQQFIQELFGGRGIVGSTLFTAGNYISRFLGGSVVFGAVNQLQEFGRIALETEQTFIRIDEALKATGRSSEGLRTTLQDVAVETNVSLDDTVEVAAQLVGVFDDLDQVVNATRVVNQLELISQGALNAREGFRSISAVASTFQDTLQELRGIDQNEAITYIADLTVRLQDLTGVNIEDTIEGLGRLGETANALNIAPELLASAIGVTTKATGQTGQASSEQIGRILSNFQSADAQDLLIRLGVTDQATVQAGEFGQVMEDLFLNYDKLSSGNQRAVANILGDPRQFATTNALLTRGSEALEVYEQSLFNQGAAAERNERILGTLRGQIGQLNKQVQEFVQLLVDLGALNVFGVLVKGASSFLTVANSILQILYNITEISPLANLIVQLGAGAAGFALLIKLAQGAINEFLRMQGIQAQGGLVASFQALRQQRQLALAEATVLSTAVSGAPAAAIAGTSLDDFLPPDAALLPNQQRPSVGRQLFDPGDLTGMFGGLDDQVGDALEDSFSKPLRTGLKGGLQSATAAVRPKLDAFKTTMSTVGPALLGIAGVAAIAVELLTRKTREAEDYFEGLFPSASEQRQEGETEEEAAARAERQAQTEYAEGLAGLNSDGFDPVKKLQASFDVLDAQFSDLDWIDYFNPSGIGKVLEGYIEGFTGDNPSSVGVDDAGRSVLDQYAEDILSARDLTPEAALEAASQLSQDLVNEAGEIVEGQETAIGKARAAEEIERLKNLADAVVSNADAQINGLTDFIDYTDDQINAVLEVYDKINLSDFSGADFQNSRADIEALFGTRLTDEAEAAVALLGSQDYQTRRRGQVQLLDIAMREARRDFRNAENKGDITAMDKARERISGILSDRASLDKEILAEAIDLPQGYAEQANRLGDYARAEALLTQSLAEIRRQKALADKGSPEESRLIGEELDALRQIAEASIQEQIDALNIDNVFSNNPLRESANSLQEAQLTLSSAIANPGAYSPTEFIELMQNVADAQEEIADAQEEVAQAYDDYLASTANNEIARTAIEYASAMRRYRRALETDAGPAAITEAATEVNEAARAQREAANALREARAQTQIARLPQGDALGTALAELRQSFSRQADVIKEFGRNSVEYEETIQEIIDLQRNATDAARAAADASLSFAQSLASAAGLDIRGARLSIQQAEAEVQRAIQDSGGDTNTAAVRQALGGLVDAQAALRDTVLGEATSTVDFMLTMEEITERQAIQVLQQILDTADLTEQQRRDLMTRIKGLKDAINQGVNEQFNLGEIRIPTPFEVRRALKVEEITQGLQDSVDAVVDLDPPTLPADNIGPAPANLLEDILGPELASEIGGLGASGGAISSEIQKLGAGLSADLLPPLSMIPRIIDEELVSRQTQIAQAESQIAAMVATGEAANANRTQIGATIAAPLQEIRAFEEQANLLQIDANQSLLDAQAHLSNMSSDTADILGAVRQLVTESGTSNNPPYADGGEARARDFQNQQTYVPPTPSPNQAINYTQTILNNFAGAGAQEVREELKKQMGPQVINRESTYTTAGRRVS